MLVWCDAIMELVFYFLILGNNKVTKHTKSEKNSENKNLMVGGDQKSNLNNSGTKTICATVA